MGNLLEAIKNDIVLSEFVVGSYVQYPNLISQDGTCFVGRINDICTNGILDSISIEDDRNQALTPGKMMSHYTDYHQEQFFMNLNLKTEM